MILSFQVECPPLPVGSGGYTVEWGQEEGTCAARRVKVVGLDWRHRTSCKAEERFILLLSVHSVPFLWVGLSPSGGERDKGKQIRALKGLHVQQFKQGLQGRVRLLAVHRLRAWAQGGPGSLPPQRKQGKCGLCRFCLCWAALGLSHLLHVGLLTPELSC